VSGRYLVTGGAGFIGGHLARRLADRGDRVVVIDDLSSGLEENVPSPARFERADLADPATYERLNDETFDVVFHFGAQPSAEVSTEDPLRDFDSNARGTFLLLRWCESRGIRRVLHASSMAVYGESDGPIAETAPLLPRSFYGTSKLAGEAYARIFGLRGLDVTIFRMFNVYGSGQNLANLRQGMASIYLAYLLDDQPIHVKGSLDRFRDFVHVTDVVDAWLATVEAPVTFGKAYNVGTGRRTTVRELVDALGVAYGFPRGECPVRVEGATGGDIQGNVADMSAMQRDLGWQSKVTLEDGLAEMVAWAKARTGNGAR